MSGKHTVLIYSTYTVRHAVTLKWLLIERFPYEREMYGTDLQHVHGTACRNIEMAAHCKIPLITIPTYGYSKIRYDDVTATN